MDRLGYTAMTAANRSMLSLEVHANNLANANTPGFRADLERAEASTVRGYGYDSRHQTLVKNNGVDLTPGSMMPTGRDMDFAVKGNGYIALEDNGGEAYTRYGSMQLHDDGAVTILGRPVLGEGGPLFLPEHTQVEISPDGIVSVRTPDDGQWLEVDRLRLVDAPEGGFAKNASGLLVTATGVPAMASDEVRITSGFLESSNVSPMESLTATMSLNRLFETQVKMMRAASDIAETGNQLLRG
ncbi:flagellar biosynthesis protein FlgF [Alkalilimnicola ehrlichii]|uniref:Flagellar basal-body rod protein FlgF n=1 Tax=Alkalilimnicola ehrlichii TaxID=351052 RepID=A0A3E0WZN5_9GAMM|nr:flagellar basal body rod protein FlgF [Alkalilimnicola ehrlichii]RFA30738.1 flagellar biosynthesis protein FlgF [Alkalilimnicola ehrlichii]RFA38314.1 flagellar biosynthesis protein FlgF [Alkalilimnicola ehrlichii]